MPNWITHLRVAQAVIDKIDFSMDAEKYYIGCIATDCGDVLFDENGKKYYNPPRYISHWTDNIPNWDAAIHFERFYDTYIKNETDYGKKSFYMGYYVHLLTDAIWIELVSRPVIESFETPQEYSKTARNQFRDDWYHTEVVFLQKNPDFYPLELLKSIKDFDNIYLAYASTEAIKANLDWLACNNNLLDADKNTEFPYFTCEAYEAVMITIERMVNINLLSR